MTGGLLRKAISLRMFPEGLSTLRRLDIAREAGFSGVEVNLEPWQEYSLKSADEDLIRLRKQVESRNMRVSAVYDREQWHFTMSSPDPSRRERCAAIVEGLARAAALLGAKNVLVMPGAVDNSILAPEPEMVPYGLAYRNSLDTLRRLARTAGERFGATLTIENCPGKFLTSPLEFARFLDEVGSARVRACFDIGNALWYGFPEHWIPALGERIAMVHVKDNRCLPGGGIAATPLLAGDVDWPAVRSALESTGYASWLTAEVLPPYRHHGERLVFDSSAAMDAIFG